MHISVPMAPRARNRFGYRVCSQPLDPRPEGRGYSFEELSRTRHRHAADQMNVALGNRRALRIELSTTRVEKEASIEPSASTGNLLRASNKQADNRRHGTIFEGECRNRSGLDRRFQWQRFDREVLSPEL